MQKFKKVQCQACGIDGGDLFIYNNKFYHETCLQATLVLDLLANNTDLTNNMLESLDPDALLIVNKEWKAFVNTAEGGYMMISDPRRTDLKNKIEAELAKGGILEVVLRYGKTVPFKTVTTVIIE